MRAAGEMLDHRHSPSSSPSSSLSPSSSPSLTIITTIIIITSEQAFDLTLHQWEEKPKNLSVVSQVPSNHQFFSSRFNASCAAQVLMREMISVQVADHGSSDYHRGGSTVKRIREHIWTKRSKIQKHGSLLPPLLQNERPAAGGVPHFIGRSRFACHCLAVPSSHLTPLSCSDLFATSHAVQRCAVV
jgi:hypothetical protein